MAVIDQSILNKSRSDKFTIIIDVPPALKNIQSNTLRSNDFVSLNSVQFSIYSCPVPDIVINSSSLPIMGQDFKVSNYTRPSYSPVDVSFVVDNAFKNYWFLWKWASIQNDPLKSIYNAPKESSSGLFNAPSNVGALPFTANHLPRVQQNSYDYTTNIHVIGRDEYNNPTVRFDYMYAAITKLGGIKYSHQNSEEIECSFSFNFNQFVVTLLETDDGTGNQHIENIPHA